MREPSRSAPMLRVACVAGALALTSCGQRSNTGPASSDAPNTGLNALTQDPVDQNTLPAGDTANSSSRAPRDISTNPPGSRPGTRLEKLGADTDVDVDDILASATPSARPKEPPVQDTQPNPADSTPAPDASATAANPTDTSLATLPETAPNAGLSALTGEDAKAADVTAEQAAAQAAQDREAQHQAQYQAQLAKLASLRRELAVFLEARRQQGARPVSDAALIVIGDAIGYDGDAKPAAPDESTLTSQERTTLSAIRTLGRALSQDGKVTDPARAVQLVDGVLSTLREAAAVRIARSALCTRVEGFGQYEPFSEYTFLAGRSTKMIVYTEIENFSHRPARSDDPGMDPLTGADLVAVELSQELRLWHDADGSMQWRKPEQPIIEVGRNKRRDFFLVQQIELPPTLSVGKYNLKVTIRDKVSGGVDERSIPIKIVADPGVIGKK